jgi:hypothetical protein
MVELYLHSPIFLHGIVLNCAIKYIDNISFFTDKYPTITKCRAFIELTGFSRTSATELTLESNPQLLPLSFVT